MPEATPTNGPAVTPPAATPPPAAPPVPAPPANEAQDVKGLPQWAQDLITNTRTEAAQHRTEKNSAVEAAKTELTTAHAAELEKVTGEKATAEADAAGARLTLTKLQVALKAEVPADAVVAFADLLKGDTEEALKAHAEDVKKIFGLTGTPAVDPTQGLGGSAPTETAPGLARLQYAYSQPKG